MNSDEILHILHVITGDARGVDADDILLSHVCALSSEKKQAFWAAFGEALSRLWQAPTQTNDELALEKAASFIARLPAEARPDDPMALAGIRLLHDAGINPTLEHPESWPRIASALRILTHLELGDGQFWRQQLEFWRDKGLVTSSTGFFSAALDALVQAVRGVVAAEGMQQRDFLCLFNSALEAAEFPAIEIYSALVEETRKERPPQDARQGLLAWEITSALASFLRAVPRVSSNATNIKHIEDLREVVAAWLKDEFNETMPAIRVDTNEPPWQVLRVKDDMSPKIGEDVRPADSATRA